MSIESSPTLECPAKCSGWNGSKTEFQSRSHGAGKNLFVRARACSGVALAYGEARTFQAAGGRPRNTAFSYRNVGRSLRLKFV